MEKSTLKTASDELREIVAILSASNDAEIAAVREKAKSVLLENCGSKVYYRGLIEFSNLCACDCLYCGIRRSNINVNRYELTEQQIVEAALWSARQGYGSVVLQSGERKDRSFVDFVEKVVTRIKKESVSDALPEGLGITLCSGEQTEETYRRWFDAGAHRYLLRIESSSPEIFARIHPSSQTLESRIECLRILKKTGYQTGTGVMIGLPGQTVEDLAKDVLFFKEMDVDMIGMGPFIAHKDTPLSSFLHKNTSEQDRVFQLSLLMIAACRITLRNVNIAATTALQAIKEDGREQGLEFGANVIMPQLTPLEVRKDYLLYEGKPCLDENAQMCRLCLERRIKSVGRSIGYNEWGDSKHAAIKS